MGRKRRSKKKDRDKIRIIIAGGGTGGHLFPGIAVGREILEKYPGSKVIFVTGGRRMETDILNKSGFHHVPIHVEGLKGMGWRKTLGSLLKLPYGFAQAVSVILRYSPQIVLGVGGYSSGPVCLAARIMGKPAAIHEQNSFPGLTNRILSRIVERVFISFEESRNHFPGGTINLTGNPIRKEFFETKKYLKEAEKGLSILVSGGSQGAMAINRAFIGALELLKEKGIYPHVIHQTGEMDFDRVRGEYRDKGLQGDITPFIRDMAGAYHEVDIFIGRAGAGTIFELAALGKPSILIPYPYAANKHQDSNARLLAEVGGAIIVLQDELTSLGLADILVKIMENKINLKEMGEKARRLGRADAAKRIVEYLEEMMSL